MTRLSVRIGDIELRNTHEGKPLILGGSLAELVKWEGDACFAVAFVEPSGGCPAVDVRSVNDRPWLLSEEERAVMDRLCRFAFEEWRA
jgi:hypothetical protein